MEPIEGWSKGLTREEFNVVFLVWNLTIIWFPLPLTVLMVIRMVREMRKTHVDLFKIIQCATMALAMGLNSVRLVFSLIFRDKILIFVDLYNISWINYINFQL